MQYVLKQSIGSEKDYYVYSDRLIHNKLSQARIFNTLSDVEVFRKQQTWVDGFYLTVKITKAELFKVRLTGK